MPPRGPFYDAIIVGLGAMGSAAAWSLSQRGLRVLGLEQFQPLHARGSSHGETRIIRRAYFEHPDYVPLLQRAYGLWEALQTECGQNLLRLNGGLFLGAGDGSVVSGSLHSARQHGLEHELLAADEVQRRWPAFRPVGDEWAVFEPGAGFVVCENALAAFQRLASGRGAELHFNEPVLSWSATDSSVRVETPNGAYGAERLVVTAGPWLGRLLSAVNGLGRLWVERSPVLWLRPTRRADWFTPERFPVYVWELVDGGTYYGVPHLAREGAKVARHHTGRSVDPDRVDRVVQAEDEADVRTFVRARLPDLDGPVASSSVCLYTNTADGHFVIDRHPEWERVCFAGGFSGHGFKFAPLVGELLADLATHGTMPPDAAFLRARDRRLATW